VSDGERRRARRVAARLEVAYEDAARQTFLVTRDVSASGVFLIDRDPPEPGGAAQVAIALPGDREILRLRGVVARHSGAGEPQGFALRFDREGVSAADRDALERFVAEGPPR
jgi:hypothetical protein